MNDSKRDRGPGTSATDSTPEPPTGRASGTADALVRAARALFSRRGYDGTSIRAITTEADANLGAVTYHFGSKRALYDEVLRTVVRPIRARVAEVAAGPGTPLERVAGVVRCFFDHIGENPDMPRLMIQEIAAGKDPPPPVEETLSAVLGVLSGLVAEGQQAGQLRAGDPRLLALSCVAQPIHLALVGRWVKRVADVHLDRPHERRRVVEHAVGFALAGLEAPQATAANSGAAGESGDAAGSRDAVDAAEGADETDKAHEADAAELADQAHDGADVSPEGPEVDA